MSYENLTPGKYLGRIMDWQMEMVEKLKVPKVRIKFTFETPSGSCSMSWDGLVLKKDGTPNKKTIDTLRVCGFKSNKIQDLNEVATALDTSKQLELDIEKEGEYWKVQWVNEPGGTTAMDKVSAKQTLMGFDLSNVNGALMSSPAKATSLSTTNGSVPNRAPSFDKDEELPF